ncbi:hypothetical protein V8E36_003042 [Tilletia maclaganii]
MSGSGVRPPSEAYRGSPDATAAAGAFADDSTAPASGSAGLSTADNTAVLDQKRVTLMLDELERELLSQRSTPISNNSGSSSNNRFNPNGRPGHRLTGSITNSINSQYTYASTNAGGVGTSRRGSAPMGPPPSEPLPLLPSTPSGIGSPNHSRPSSTVTRINSSAGTSRSAGSSTPASSRASDLTPLQELRAQHDYRQPTAHGSAQAQAQAPGQGLGQQGQGSHTGGDAWIDLLPGPRASSTFSRRSFESTAQHVTARYTICAAEEDDEGHMSDTSRVLSLSNYHSFSNHDGGFDDDDDDTAAHRLRHASVDVQNPSSLVGGGGAAGVVAAGNSSIMNGQSSNDAPSRISTYSSIAVPTVRVDEVEDNFSDETSGGDWDDSEDGGQSSGTGGRKRRKKKGNAYGKNRWRFEDQRAIAPSLSRATAARLNAASATASSLGGNGGSSQGYSAPFSLGVGPSSSSYPASSSSGGGPPSFGGPSPSSSVSFTPGSIVPPSASEFTFYEFAPDLPPFAPKDLKPKDLTGTGTWRSIVARAVTSANASASQRASMAEYSPSSPGNAGGGPTPPPKSGPVSVRQLAAETRARQQRELVMRQRQAQLFAQTSLEPIDLHKHAQHVAVASSSANAFSPGGADRGTSPSPAPSFATTTSLMNSVDGGRSGRGSALGSSSMLSATEDDDGPALHRGVFRSASVSLSGYWDPLENISNYGGVSTVGGGGGHSIGGFDGASVRSSTFSSTTNSGLGLDFASQSALSRQQSVSTMNGGGMGTLQQQQQQAMMMMNAKVYADSGTQTSPTSSASNSRPGSPAGGGVGGESKAADAVRVPRKVLADGNTQTDDLSSSRRKAAGEEEDAGDETEREGHEAAAGGTSSKAKTSRSQPKTPARATVRPVIGRRRSTLGIGAGGESRDEEPEGWATPIRAPKLSSRRSNIGTSPRVGGPRLSAGNSPVESSSSALSPLAAAGVGGRPQQQQQPMRRTSMNTLGVVPRKPLSPLGLGRGMHKDGLSQTEGSDAGISSEDDDSDADSCESDLDLNTPLEELAERSGALEVKARGEKRKFDAQRARQQRQLQSAGGGGASKLSPASAARMGRGSDGNSKREDAVVAGRVVAPLPRGLRQAAHQGKLGPRGQIGGTRVLGAGLRAGAMRTTAVAYSSDEEDATATETEPVIRSSSHHLRTTKGSSAGLASYPRLPASFTQPRPPAGAGAGGAAAAATAAVRSAVAAAALAAARGGEVSHNKSHDAEAPSTNAVSADSALGSGSGTPQTPVAKLAMLSSEATPSSAGDNTIDGDATEFDTPTAALGRSTKQQHSPLRRGMSIPELDALLLSHKKPVKNGDDRGSVGSARGLDRALVTGMVQGVPAAAKSGGSSESLGDDEDLLTSDLDFAMPPSGESFQSIDDLDGLLDTPHQSSGYGVRSVTGTASLRKPISVPALVTERLGSSSRTPSPPTKRLVSDDSVDTDVASSSPLRIRKDENASVDHSLRSVSTAQDDDEDPAYESSTIHGHQLRAESFPLPTSGSPGQAVLDGLASLSRQRATTDDEVDSVAHETPVSSSSAAPMGTVGSRTPTSSRSGSLSSAPSKTMQSSRNSVASSVTSLEPAKPTVAAVAPEDDASTGVARQRAKSQTSRIRAPTGGRSSLPSPAAARSTGLRQPGSFSAASSTEKKANGKGPAEAATPVAGGVAKPLRKMKSFGDRSSSTFVSPSISTMPRSRPSETPSPDLVRGTGTSSGSSRPGSAAASRRTTSTAGTSRPPSSTSMRRSVIPARKNSDALPSNLPQPPSAAGATASSATSAAKPRFQSALVTPKKTALRSPGQIVQAASLEGAQKPALPRAGSSPTSVLSAASPVASTETDTSPETQHTPTLSSRASDESSPDSPPMPATPGPPPVVSAARRMTSTSNLRKPSAIARPSGLPAPSPRQTGLPMPKSYKV